MYPVMLPGPVRDDFGITSYRNPDGLFPERQGIPPDRLGVLFVRFLGFLEDRWDVLRRPGKRDPEQMADASSPPGDAVLQTK